MKQSEFKVISLNKSFYMKPDEYLNGWAKKCGWKASLVYDSLWRHADRSREAFPSIKLMAEEHGISTDSVKRGVKTLEDFGIIAKSQSHGKSGKFLHNTYYLLAKEHWKDPTVGVHSTTVHRSMSQHPTVGADSTTKGTHINYTHTLSKGFGSIKSLGEQEFSQIAEFYSVPVAFVRSKYDDMVNWHESTGRTKKNWLATLRNWVKADAMKVRKGAEYANSKRAIDARGIR